MNDKDTLNDTLNTINQWTNNCDTKVSVILGIFGVIYSIFFSSDYVKVMAIILKKCFADLSICKVLYLIILVLILLYVGKGFWKLIRVLTPTINTDRESLMFFGGIAKCDSLTEYETKVKNYSENDVKNDLIYQIHSAANICTQKFERQKEGLLALCFGTAILGFWVLLGYIMFYI